jgi:uncharacterized protein (TIGR02099 family)
MKKPLKRIVPSHHGLLYHAWQRVPAAVRRAGLAVAGHSLWIGGGLLALLTVLFVVARLLLPGVADRKGDIESYLSRAAGQRIEIEKLGAHWDGLNPGLRAEGVNVFAPGAVRPAVRLSEVRLSIALLPLIVGEAQINRLVVSHPRLALERLVDGRFRITGIGTVAPEGDGAVLNWLLRQGWLIIEDGELQWTDRRDDAPPVLLTHVDLSLRNDGDRHEVEISASFPPALCRECALRAEIRGNPLQQTDWSGDFLLRTRELNLEALPRIARELLPARLRGRVTADLEARWADGAPRSLAGPLRLAGLRLPVPHLAEPLDIRVLQGELDWIMRKDGWRLNIADAEVGLRGQPWSAGDLRLDYAAGGSSLTIGRVNLDDVTTFVTTLAVAPEDRPRVDPWRQALIGLAPGGALERLQLDVNGGGDYQLEAGIANVSTEVYERVPGVRGLSGHLHLGRDRGEVEITSAGLRLDYAQLFREPFQFREAGGRISWERGARGWNLKGDNLTLAGDDIGATGTLALDLPDDGGPVIDLNVAVDYADGSHARRYFPAKVLHPETLAWMDSSFLGGRVESASLVLQGPLRDFPYRGGGGRFEIRARVGGAVYNFLSGWMPVRDGDVDVSVLNSDVIVTGRGRLGALQASQINVRTQVEHAPGEERAVTVGARFDGPVAETLAVLRDVKLQPGDPATWQGYLPEALQAAGDGVLHLGLRIPLDKTETNIAGDYRVTRAVLAVTGAGVRVEDVAGAVQFDGNGPRSGELHGRLAGGDMRLAIATPPRGVTRYEAGGRIPAAGLAPLLGSAMAPNVSGEMAWEGSWSEVGLRAALDLRGLRATLPAPLNRPDGLMTELLTLRSEFAPRASARNHVLVLGPGGGVSGRFALAREAVGWRFGSGHIAFGETFPVGLPYERGVSASVFLDRFDVDAWLAHLPTGARGSAAEVVGGLPPWIRHLTLDIRALDAFERHFGRLVADLGRTGTGWAGALNGDVIAGRGKIDTTAQRGRLDLDLERLRLPERRPGETRESSVDPRDLPTMNVRAKVFELKGRTLGEFEFLAMPVEQGWRIARVALVRPETRIEATGYWLKPGGRSATSVDLRMTSTNLGETLGAFGFPDQMKNGEVELQSSLNWLDNPDSPALANLSGRLTVTARKGGFPKVQQGAARLFGLLDLSSIGRYLTLDFSPLFGQGLIFDEIRGNISLDNGIAQVHDLSIRPPAANVGVSGRVGLVSEEFDLKIEVEPKLADTITIASWGIFGPQVAAVVLAVQKLFKKQITEGTRMTYVVKGPWAEPRVTRTRSGPEVAAPGS